MHTDLPMFSEIYTAEIVRRTFGDGVLGRIILNDAKAGARSREGMRRKVDDMIHRSDHFLSANREDLRRAARIVGAKNVSRLRRGVDKARFNPDRRDRERLEARFGIPVDCPILLFVGRIDATKRALFAAAVARRVIDGGQDLRFLAIGEGAEKPAIADLLGDKAVLPGFVPQEDLAWIYPGADCFLFPSETETVGNVVIEAKASGLPVLVADHAASSLHIRRQNEDGFILSTSDPAAWRQTVASLLRSAELRRRIGAEARRTIEDDWPSWRDVVEEDLLPVWRRTVPRAVPTGFSAPRHAPAR
jgi:glycosyltransferase involved in cell wall biosynthesis